MEYILFLVVILLSNIVQGITGFAGTLLAMPFAIVLVGYDVGKPILNVLGLLSGIYVFLGNRKSVNWKELKKIVLIMTAGIIGGIFIKDFFASQRQLLEIFLGIFVIYLGIKGLFFKKKVVEQEQKPNLLKANGLLIFAGIVHGIFVSGGTFLVGYLSKIIKDKTEFRATISTVWIFLNSMLLFDDIRLGLFDLELIKWQLISIPFLFIGMKLGTILYHKMSQELFMKITYVLLIISGITLFS